MKAGHEIVGRREQEVTQRHVNRRQAGLRRRQAALDRHTVEARMCAQASDRHGHVGLEVVVHVERHTRCVGIHDADLHHVSIVYEWSIEPTEVTEAPDLNTEQRSKRRKRKNNFVFVLFVNSVAPC